MEETMCERTDRVVWAVRRARANIRRGNFAMAWMGLVTDLEEHPATRNHPAVFDALRKGHAGGLSTGMQVQDFVDAVA